MANGSSAPRTVEVSLVAGVSTIDMAPGKPASMAYTYNGRSPGPTLVATEGDHVIIHFTNNLTQPTTVVGPRFPS